MNIIRNKKLLSLLSNLLQKEHIQKDNIQAMKSNENKKTELFGFSNATLEVIVIIISSSNNK